MASSKQVLLLAVVAAVACLASLASATQWVVGDECGWRAKFNQTGWADGKTFVVGDTLLFKYPKGKHTVVQVGEEDFATCNHDDDDDNQLGVWCSGNDVVRLDKPGKMWFICTKCNHCLKGMKLAIDVVDDDDVAAPPPPPVITFPFPGTAPPPPPPRSAAAMRNLVGGAVAVAAAVLAAALVF
ncbi:basic blue protein-like [Miscanthus floridulus]|uniref:basic blue protein-like n=1 Tax=Miscanthus floridulus TaxID=154761 RepID=UPI00345A9ADE